MQKSLNAFVKRLNDENEKLKIKLNTINSAFGDQNLMILNEVEQQINATHFFRSIGYAGTHAVFYYAKSYELIKEVQTEFTTSLKYLTSDSIEFESFINEEIVDGELNNYFIKCEQEYILWFARLWHSVGCHKNNRINYALLENNSGKTFDLNKMKWVLNVFECLSERENFYSENSIFNDKIAQELIQLNYEY